MEHKAPPAEYLNTAQGQLAYLRREGRSPGLLWLGGYASDMRGTKAEALDAHAAETGLSYLRFDYSGHGESDGGFEEGTIGRWAEDAAQILAHLTDGPQILVGSSMGAWIAGLLARTYPERIAGMILIAPAPDFTTELTPKQWAPEMMERLHKDGRLEIPSEFDDSVMVYTKALFDDGATNRVLSEPLPVNAPVRILTGMRDDVVPYAHALRYAEHLGTDDVRVTLVKDGDHRMSGEGELQLLRQAVDELAR